MHINKNLFFCIGILLVSMVQCIKGMDEKWDIFEKSEHTTQVLLGKHLSITREGEDFVFYKEVIKGLDKDCVVVTHVSYSNCATILTLMYFKILPPDIKRYITLLMLGHTLDSNFEYLKTFKGHTDLIKAVAFSPNGEKMAMASYDKTVSVWNIESGQQLFKFDQHSQSVPCVIFSPDGDSLLTGSDDTTARLWSLSTGEQLLHVEEEPQEGDVGGIQSVAFSTCGSTVVTGSLEGIVSVWDAVTGQSLLCFHFNGGRICSAVFSLDGAKIFFGTSEGNVSVFHVAKTRELLGFKLKGTQKDFISAVAFSPDRQLVLFGYKDGIISLCNIEKKKCLLKLKGHNGMVISLAFSPDSTTILSCSWGEDTARLWDSSTGLQLLKLKADCNGVHSVAFSFDGKKILLGSYEGVAYLWGLSSCEATDWIRNNSNPYQVWFFTKALEGRSKGRFRVNNFKDSIEYEILNGLPDFVQEYVMKWDSITIVFTPPVDSIDLKQNKPLSEDHLLDLDFDGEIDPIDYRPYYGLCSLL